MKNEPSAASAVTVRVQLLGGEPDRADVLREAAAASGRRRRDGRLAVGAAGVAVGESDRAHRGLAPEAVAAGVHGVGQRARRVVAAAAVRVAAQHGFAAGIAGAIGDRRVVAPERHAFALLALDPLVVAGAEVGARAAIGQVGLQVDARKVTPVGRRRLAICEAIAVAVDALAGGAGVTERFRNRRSSGSSTGRPRSRRWACCCNERIRGRRCRSRGCRRRSRSSRPRRRARAAASCNRPGNRRRRASRYGRVRGPAAARR